MSITLRGNSDAVNFFGQSDKSILAKFQRDGRFPPLKVNVFSLESKLTYEFGDKIRIIEYRFESNMLVPVDTFSFVISAPDADPVYTKIKDGDLLTVSANNVAVFTGIIDAVDTETENEAGETVTIEGRDLVGQLEDQDAVSINAEPIFSNRTTLRNATRVLLRDTRIKGLNEIDTPQEPYQFATMPGEKKVSALQRFTEPLNCIFWAAPNGSLNIGRPNFSQEPSGKFILSRTKRQSNVLSMKSRREAASIPNIYVPIWTGQEQVQNRVGPSQAYQAVSKRPSELYKLGHILPRTVVISSIDASNPQGQADLNRFEAAGQTKLQAYAKREAARENQGEHLVEVVVPGHYTDSGAPFTVNKVWDIEYDRGDVYKKMFCYGVSYSMSEEGQRTNLMLCNLGTIVSDVAVR